jgi:putative addiction module killer protein
LCLGEPSVLDANAAVSYKRQMFEVRLTEEFQAWLGKLKDDLGKAKITSRIRRLGTGNAGDVAPVGDGISEMRIHSGPGYRVYYKQTGKTVILILLGGDKSTQAKDIETAKAIAAEF